jgi:DNA-binding XRE family transcriptional regulator
MNATQSKMARAALGLSTHDLASLAGVGRMTVVRFEQGIDIAEDGHTKIRAAFEAQGIRFVDRGIYQGAVCPPGTA